MISAINLQFNKGKPVFHRPCFLSRRRFASLLLLAHRSSNMGGRASRRPFLASLLILLAPQVSVALHGILNGHFLNSIKVIGTKGTA